MLPIAALLVLVVAPLAFAIIGMVRMRGEPPVRHEAVRPWRWRMSAVSMLLYTLAFNLTFFVQELFLVLPKALTPGLRPTLFHNNHGWEGTHPLASLFQGTGALATLLVGIAAGLWLRRTRTGPAWWRLLVFWMAFGGVFMALPQAVIGALVPQGDVGMAMTYFGLGPAAKATVALLALIAMPLFALWLLRPLLELAGDPAQVAGAGARMRFVLLAATLPALLAIVLIVPFRMPREWVEVLLLPVIVTVAGLAWTQAGAWRIHAVRPLEGRGGWPIGALLAAVIALLAVFQLVLRPGIAFY
ncbi:hypothetical protein [Luteimonas salinilitoris]|uniref:Uncharacterized protein n=1 Tax=Luteimonas salinilitoris TaxID=3237697 RepID=A0ABV4HS82_9GAMM